MEHPIWRILAGQGRSKAWLARVTGYHPVYVRRLASRSGLLPTQFRWRCVLALNLPEDLLFAGDSPPGGHITPARIARSAAQGTAAGAAPVSRHVAPVLGQ